METSRTGSRMAAGVRRENVWTARQGSVWGSQETPFWQAFLGLCVGVPELELLL